MFELSFSCSSCIQLSKIPLVELTMITLSVYFNKNREEEGLKSLCKATGLEMRLIKGLISSLRLPPKGAILYTKSSTWPILY